MNKIKATAIALAIPAVLALSGCADTGSSEDATDTAVIWYDWDPNGPAMLALLTTKLELNDGCLMGEGGTFLAFPRGLGSWNANDETLTFGGATYTVGDTINAGGGGGSIPRDATVPDSCDVPSDGAVFLIQSSSLS